MYANRLTLGKRTFFYFFAFSVYDFDGWYTSSDFDENSKLAGINQGEKAEDIDFGLNGRPRRTK